MSIKIALSALLFSGALWFGFSSFKRARDSIDPAIDGVKYHWCLVGLWFCLSLLSAGLASGIIIHWLSVCRTGCL